LTKSLKILQITNRIPYPLNDGGNIATYNLTKFFSRFEHTVFLASLNTKKHYQDPKQLSTIAKVYTTDINTDITAWGLLLGIFSAKPYNVSRFYSDDFLALLKKIINEHQPDIIQMEGIYMAIYADEIKKITSSPLILRSHNIESEIWERTAKHEKNVFKKGYLSLLSKKIKAFEVQHMHAFDAILSITKKDELWYKQQNFKGHLKTITAGVDTELYTYIKPSHNATSICFIGSMEWMPNVQGIHWYLEKIWPILNQKFPQLTLHIAGKGMTEEMKNKKINGVTFYGMVSDAKEFLNAHQIMIVPLLSGGGMRLKILEGMALGKCVMSTTIGAEGIEATDDKELIIADSIEQFILKTEQLITNLNSIETIGFKASKLIQEKYSWEKLVREIEKFYIELS